MRTYRNLFLTLLVLFGFSFIVDHPFAIAQNEKKADTKPDSATQETKNEDSDSNEVEILPKLEEMQIPTVEELLKKPPVDWVVLENDSVLVVEPIYPT